MKDLDKELDELIKRLEKIKEDGEGLLNYPKAFYVLALLIKELKKTFEDKK